MAVGTCGAVQLFWHWYDKSAMVSGVGSAKSSTDCGVGHGADSTFDIVRDHAKKMNGISLAIQK
jgi:hypothetical protein